MASDGEVVAIHVAGDVRIVGAGAVVRPRTVGGPRCDDLVAFLSVHRHREVPLEELADVVWPHRRPSSWYSGLRGLLIKVRSAVALADIPAATVRARGGTVRLSLPDGLVTDLDVARRCCRPIGDDVAAAIADARAALEILDQPILPTSTGAWVDAVRADVAEMTDVALTIDATGSLTLGHHEGAATAAERLLTLDPLRENTYRILIRARMGLGERGRALTAAARCRQVLREQLGELPSPETEELFLELLRDTPTADPTPPTPHRDAVVGRDTELRIVADCVARSATGRGQFLVVSGEAGAGKSTIVSEAMARATEAGARVLFGRCTEEATVSFEPFVDAARRDRHPILQILSAGESTESTGTHAPDADHRADAMDALVDWVTPAIDDGPTVLVIDDLHWASTATLNLIGDIVATTADRRVCVVVTVRDEHTDRPRIRELLAVGDARAEAHRVRLRGFEVGDVADLIAINGAALDPAILHARTGGLPMFVTSLITDHELGSDRRVPASIAESVRHREGVLSDVAQRALRLCAVMGMTTPRTVLREAMPECDDLAFASALDELIHHRLVTESDSGGDVLLRHPLVADAVYDRITVSLREQMHSEVARALEWSGIAGHADAARLAHHLARGVDADRAASVDHFRRAGDSAMAIGAHEDAVDLYRSAAQRLTPEGDSAARCELMVAAGRAQRRARDPAFHSTLLEAVAMARRLGDLDLLVTATLANNQQGVLNIQIVADSERIESLRGAIEALDAAGRPDGSEIAHLTAQLVIESIWVADHRERRDLVVRGMAAARAADDGDALVEILVAALTGIHHRDLDAMRYAAYRELMDHLSASTGRTVEPLRAVRITRAHIHYGQLDHAGRTLDRISPSHLTRDPETAWLAKVTRYGIAHAAGRLDLCESELVDLRSIPAAPTTGYSYGRILPSLFSLRMLRGDMGEIVDAASGLVERFHIIGFYRMCLAAAYADCGDLDAAADLVAWHTRDRIEAIADDPLWMCSMAVLGRVAAQVGDTEVCDHVLRLLAPYGDQTVASGATVLGVVHQYLAEAAMAVGDLDRAAVHIDDALSVLSARDYRGWYADAACLAVALEVRRDGMAQPATVNRARRSADETGATAVRRRLDPLIADTSALGTVR
ncbi:ATP-binding protein [Williamsia sp. MIQD14]|uniref:ATP-binding protein n=1 Tax=Williamsia sp. MIQD14 TaxID=3425703 RepID=UPI003DA03F55